MVMVALVVIAVVVFSSLAGTAIYVGFRDRSSRRKRDLQRADSAHEPDPTNSLGPGERAANEATKWI